MFINPRNITIPGLYIKVKSLIIYPNFTDNVLSKIQILYDIYTYIYIYVYIYIYSFSDIASLFQEQTSNKILPVVHIFSLTIMTYLKMSIGIKSLNTRQFSARLSSPPVKLSSFIGGKFSPKNGESN